MTDRYLVLGFSIPDGEMKLEFEKDELPQIQTHLFNRNLIKCFESINNIRCEYLSFRPVSDYPLNKSLYLKKKKWHEKIGEFEIEIQEMPFINFGIFKIISRLISVLFFVLHRVVTNRPKGIVVYSVHLPYMLTAWLATKLLRIELISVWTDPPSIDSKHDSKVKGMLRGCESWLSRFLMSKSMKNIVLTKYLALDFSPGSQYEVVEGFIDDFIKNVRQESKPNTKIVLYAGSLHERYGILNLIKGFRNLDKPNIELHIYGRGDSESAIQDMIQEDKRIKYFGFVDNSIIKTRLSKASILINTRSNSEYFVKYSFPSKTLEYISSGTPLMTTMLDSYPEQYKDYILELKDNAPSTITERLDMAFLMDDKDLYDFGLKAKKFVQKNHYRHVAIRVERLLNSSKI
ncbi:glycosyltransferase [Vibrio coralliirubri]|uniref:glycosyltransferase n=1 Tax=Vibrio coralliirubri TaxID=1516159 RepID=UPI000A3A9093|nr:glycosyltransferase [Vibrio coralliirubri]